MHFNFKLIYFNSIRLISFKSAYYILTLVESLFYEVDFLYKPILNFYLLNYHD